MKNPTPPAPAALIALALAFSPVLLAQQSSGTDQQQNAPAQGGSIVDQNAASANAGLDKNQALQANTKYPSQATSASVLNGTAAARESAENGSGSERDRGASSENKPVSDQQFILTAAQGGMAEVELGKLASQKASSSQVKAFGERMVNDHSKADDQLKGIAQQKGVQLPERLDSHHQAMVDRLSKLNGPAFDKAYVKMMVHDHEKDVSEFKHESEAAQDPQVKTFAGDTLKTIQSHLDEARSLQGQLK